MGQCVYCMGTSIPGTLLVSLQGVQHRLQDLLTVVSFKIYIIQNMLRFYYISLHVFVTFVTCFFRNQFIDKSMCY